MTENQRVKKVRKALNLSQELFGTPIGLTQSAIAVMEAGRAKVTEQTKILMNHIFNVNRAWLDSEEGDMFLDIPSQLKETDAAYGKNNYELKKEIEYWKDKYMEVNEKYTSLLERQINNKNNDKSRAS